MSFPPVRFRSVNAGRIGEKAANAWKRPTVFNWHRQTTFRQFKTV